MVVQLSCYSNFETCFNVQQPLQITMTASQARVGTTVPVTTTWLISHAHVLGSGKGKRAISVSMTN